MNQCLNNKTRVMVISLRRRLLCSIRTHNECKMHNRIQSVRFNGCRVPNSVGVHLFIHIYFNLNIRHANGITLGLEMTGGHEERRFLFPC